MNRRVNVIAVVRTVIEIVTLVGGLAYGREWKDVLQIWFAGLFVEEVVGVALIKGLGHITAGRLVLLIVGVSVETIGWFLSFRPGLVIQQRIGIQFVFFSVEHAIIRAVLGERFSFRGVLDFSVVEAVGGGVWASFPSVGTAIVMAGTSIFEHVQAVRQAFHLRG